MGYRPAKPDSPAYTEEQHRRVAAYRKLLLDLSTQGSSRPFWSGRRWTPATVDSGRMKPKQVDDQPMGGAA